jgi:hypothetical protein
MEEQEDSTKAHLVRRPRSTQDPKGQVKGKNAQQVGRLVHSNRTTNEAAFKLRRMSGEDEPYMWNVDMLQKYFV